MHAVALLTFNDLAVAFKNKTIYLLLFIPLFVFLALTAVDRPGAASIGVMKLGFNRSAAYPPQLVASLEALPQQFSLQRLGDDDALRQAVLRKELDAAFLPLPAGGDPAVVLMVKQRGAVKTLALLSSLAAVQHAAEGGRGSWVAELTTAAPEGELDQQMLPLWILMMILLVGFLVMPPQVAEEKEKKWLLGLLQTPVRESQWLAAKVLTGMLLSLLPVLLLHAVSRSGFGYLPSYAALLLAGSFCFTSLGLVVGCLCRSQAGARTLGLVLYLPHLLPSALGDFSTKLQAVSAMVPSSQLFNPLRSVLLSGAHWQGLAGPVASLLGLGAVACAVAHLVTRRRWLM